MKKGSSAQADQHLFYSATYLEKIYSVTMTGSIVQFIGPGGITHCYVPKAHAFYTSLLDLYHGDYFGTRRA